MSSLCSGESHHVEHFKVFDGNSGVQSSKMISCHMLMYTCYLFHHIARFHISMANSYICGDYALAE